MNTKAINQVLADLPCSILSEQNRLFVDTIANHLPKSILCCLEIHNRSKADFLYCIDLVGSTSFDTFPLDVEHSIKSLSVKWNSNEFLKENIRNIWITYDFVYDSVSKPWAYILLQKNVLGKDIQKIIIPKIIASITTGTSPIQSEILLRIIDKLPNQAYIFGLSAHVRADEKNRLIIGNIKPNDIVSYLKALQWQGALSQLKKICSAVDLSLWYSILLDYSQTICPDIGIEVWFEHSKSKDQANRLIQSLVKNKILEADAMQTEVINSFSITDNQWINHIKLKISGSGKLEVKTYLFFNS